MKTFRIIGLTIIAILLCLSACSGGDDPIEPTPKPEVVVPEITMDSSIITNGLNFTNEKGEQSISFTTNENWTLSIAKTRSGVSWCTASATSGSKGNNTVKFTIAENTTYDDRSVSVTIKSGSVSKTFSISQKGVDALLITSNKYEVSQEGGKIEVEVKANIDYQISISETAKEWISESPSRTLTSYKHIFNIALNEENEKREGEITFKSGDKEEIVKVYQAGGPIILLSQNEYNVSDTGDTIAVEVKSNIEFGVQMSNVDWITDESSSRGMSSHTMKYIVSPNEEYDNRTAFIIFYDKNSDWKDTLKITQVQKNAIILSKKEFNVSHKGETIEVELSSNIDFEISIGDDWVTQVDSTSSRGLVSHKLHFKVTENTSEEERSTQIKISDKDKQISESIIIKQNNKEKDIPYLTFSAVGKQTLTMSKAVETLEYSVNGEEWKELGTNTVEFGSEKGDLRLRGSNPRGTANDLNDYATIIFGTNVLVTSSGDLCSLIDYKNFDATNTEQAKFCYLFHKCEVLRTAPNLSATTLADKCYFALFLRCTNLIKVPALPALNLAYLCYARMFEECTKLVNAPEIKAENLAYYCCDNMFSNCTNLINAPELPVNKLENYCYQRMFRGCTSLVNAPDLPAMDLAIGCYNNMFEGCKKLVNPPQLPATNLKSSCYKGMFSNCTRLMNAPKLPAITLDYYCYASMFEGCTSLVTAPELPGLVLGDYCYRGMFLGCKALINAPELPATTLTEGCYLDMFENCTSLVDAPKLPAATLASSCYIGMFEGCTSLINAPQLPATTLVNSCYIGMFDGCTSLIKAPNLPATILAELCYASMFNGCINLKEAPQLPALNLTNRCYEGMFQGCTSLTIAPILPAPQLVNSCYAGMFYGCTSLNNVTLLTTDLEEGLLNSTWLKSVSSTGTFYKAKEMDTSLLEKYSIIPKGWIVKDIESEEDFSANENLENPNESNKSEW